MGVLVLVEVFILIECTLRMINKEMIALFSNCVFQIELSQGLKLIAMLEMSSRKARITINQDQIAM